MSVAVQMTEMEALQAELAAAKAKIAELETAKPAKTRKPAEKSEAQVKHETIEYVDENTALGKLQRNFDHADHVYAAAKAVRLLPWDRTSRLLFGLCEEIATANGISVEDVITKVTTRTERKAKDDAASTDAPAAETPAAEGDGTPAEGAENA